MFTTLTEPLSNSLYYFIGRPYMHHLDSDFGLRNRKDNTRRQPIILTVYVLLVKDYLHNYRLLQKWMKMVTENPFFFGFCRTVKFVYKYCTG